MWAAPHVERGHEQYVNTPLAKHVVCEHAARLCVRAIRKCRAMRQDRECIVSELICPAIDALAQLAVGALDIGILQQRRDEDGLRVVESLDLKTFHLRSRHGKFATSDHKSVST